MRAPSGDAFSWWTSWCGRAEEYIRSLKGTKARDGGEEKSENQRWRRGRERQGGGRGGDAEIGRRYPPTRHGTIIRRINGMRFWNFVLFCATGHFNRRISRSALVPAARILQWHFQRTNKSNISIEFPYAFGLLAATRIGILLYLGRGILAAHLPRENISTLKAAFEVVTFIYR